MALVMPTPNAAMRSPVLGVPHLVSELTHTKETKGRLNLMFKTVTLIWVLLLDSRIRISRTKMVTPLRRDSMDKMQDVVFPFFFFFGYG